jgi:hypothetical protein
MLADVSCAARSLLRDVSFSAKPPKWKISWLLFVTVSPVPTIASLSLS